MFIRLIIAFVLLLCNSVNSQNDVYSEKVDSVEDVIVNKNVNESTIWLKSDWLFTPDDDVKFAEPNLNDSNWIKTKSTLNEVALKKLNFNGFGWFRYHLKVDSFQKNVPTVIYLDQKGASEVYIDGLLFARYGVVSKSPDLEQRVNQSSEAIYLPYKDSGEYVIAVRFSNLNYKNSYNGSGMIYSGFQMFLTTAENFFNANINSIISQANYGLALFVFFCVMGLLHLLLFAFYSIRKSNLYFSLFCFLFSFYFLNIYIRGIYIDAIDSIDLLNIILVVSFPIFFVSFLSVLFSLFDNKFPKQFKFYLGFSIVSGLTFLLSNQIGFVFSMIIIITVAVESIIFIIKINKQKKRGAILISSGFGAFIAFIVLSVIKMLFTGTLQLSSGEIADEVLYILLIIGLLSIPISMSAFLAWDFAQTSKTLTLKLSEVEELSEKTIEQEKEKQKLLAEQNSMLEFQVKERTKEIEEQKKVIEEKNKDITDSINYAQRIQHSILPTSKEIKDIFPDSLVLFKPRDIVSGDFYQFKQVNNYKFGILADCTGHGVPGALMSMIGSNLLHQIIMERKIVKPNLILTELHKEVKSTLRQTAGVQSHDGMDIAVCMVNGNELFIASANRPVYLFIDGVLNEIKPDKKSIGGASTADVVEFTLHNFTIDKEIKLYTFSDGYADQFGGVNGKKFKVKNLQELIVANLSKPLNEQLEILGYTFENWRGTLEQVDDVSLIAIHLKPY
ncbi:MAG: SpoIIE family protein phosphatase [Bacteroidia bacterium]|nr:SpoIIE family protein phosphatase [Bacteroidia bacterium]